MKHNITSHIRSRITSIALVLSMACILVTGCGQTEINQINEAGETSDIKFSWWGNDPRHLYTMEGVDLFMEQNKDIDVDYIYGIWNGYESRNRVYMNANREPDVMQINYGWLSQYSADGNGYYNLYELTDYIDLSGYTEADLSFGEVNGKLNALPIAYNSAIIYYNEDILKAAGVEAPNTWDDLFVAAKAIGDDKYLLGGVKKHVFLLLMAYYEQTTGKRAFSTDSINLTAEDLEYVLEFYKKLIDEKVLMPIDQFDRNMLSTGELVGSIFWISDISNYCGSIESCGHPVLGSYLTMSEGDEIVGWYKKPATMYAISAVTEYPEASARLLNYLVNDSNMAVLQGTEKGIPVSAYALEAIEAEGLYEGYSVDANNQMIEADEMLHIMPPEMEDENIIDIFKTEADAYIYGKASLEETAENIYNGLKNER